MTNPFEREGASFVVLQNEHEQYSLWPSTLEVPSGWMATEIAGPRQACLDWVDANWTVMKPRVAENPERATECAGATFERQAALTPEAVALQYGEDTLTFCELNHCANQLAHYLRRQGVVPESLVAVWLPRTADAVIAILGILKAGGGYIVLDQSYPKERLATVVAEARPSVVISTADLDGHLPPLPIRVLRLDAEAALLKQESSENPPPTCLPHNVAYVTFTSGTTSKPKGVVVTHESIVNRISDVPFMRDAPDEVCALTSSLSFGMSVAQLFLPLFCGVRLVIVPEDAVRDTRRLVDVLERAHVSVVTLVTPLLREVLRQGRAVTSRLARLRTVITGGAPVTEDLLHAFAAAFPETRLVNSYAASEVGGAILVGLYHAALPSAPSLGRPITNTRVHLLDEEMDEVPLGTPGEIYVGAGHLARGYLGMPGVTAERFVADPSGSGGRVYRTGDLGRSLVNGEIQFLGRVDGQVKIRGFRVSLEEVEGVLQGHPSVRQAAVWLQQIGDEQRLVGYIVPASMLPTVSDLRAHLHQSLPEYMVPTAFASVPRLPMTATGKVDRRALPPIDLIRPTLNELYTPPATPVQKLVSQIWAEVLNLDRVGINDSFVELGGDSLTGIQVLVRVADELGVEIPFDALFEYPTVAGFVGACLSNVESGSFGRRVSEIE